MMVLVVLLWTGAMARAAPGLDLHWQAFPRAITAENGLLCPAQYYTRPPRRIMRPRRFLPPRLRGFRSPRQKMGRRRMRRGRMGRGDIDGGPRVSLSPSQALKRALRRWPDAIGLSVRLLRRDRPVYVVRVRSGTRVEQVLVDAVTGKVLR